MIKLRCNACGFEGVPEAFHQAIVIEHNFQCVCGSYKIDTSALAKKKGYKYGNDNTLKPFGRAK